MPDIYEQDAGDFILLGGQISNKHPEYKTIAQLDAKSAFIVMLLDNLDKLQEMNPIEQAKALIFMKGQINFMANCGELTKLSAIMGDTRKSFSSKGLKDALWRYRTKPTGTDTSAPTP